MLCILLDRLAGFTQHAFVYDEFSTLLAVPVRQCGGLVLSLYDQCGGETNCPNGISCSDAQW